MTSPRNLAIVAARKSGKTYKDIGAEFGISAQTARIVVKKSERGEAERKRLSESVGPVFASLSVRAKNCLKWSGHLDTDDKIRAFVATSEGREEILREPNLGRKTLAEICAAYDVPITLGHKRISEPTYRAALTIVRRYEEQIKRSPA